MGEVAEKDATWANVVEPVATLCRRAVWLSHLIAPDLAGLPLYVVPQSALVDDFGSAEHAGGYTTPSLDLYLRDAIGSLWRGRGPCMVVNDIAILDDWPEDFELFFMATVLHELAHIIERPILFRDHTSTDVNRLKFEALVTASIVNESEPASMAKADFHHHGERFIRAALHLQYRAALAGTYVGPALLCGGRKHGLSHACAYQAVLGDDPERCLDANIRDVLETPAPDEFSRLWQLDLADWTAAQLY